MQDPAMSSWEARPWLELGGRGCAALNPRPTRSHTPSGEHLNETACIQDNLSMATIVQGCLICAATLRQASLHTPSSLLSSTSHSTPSLLGPSLLSRLVLPHPHIRHPPLTIKRSLISPNLPPPFLLRTPPRSRSECVREEKAKTGGMQCWVDVEVRREREAVVGNRQVGGDGGKMPEIAGGELVGETGREQIPFVKR